MFNAALFKQTFRTNFQYWLLVVAVLSMYIAVIIYMYDPSMIDKLNAVLSFMPKQFISAFGFDLPDTSFTGFLCAYLYGFLLLLIPLIHTIIVAHRLIARFVDNGSMAYLLATPNSRRKIAFTQMMYLVLATFVMVVFATGYTMAVCAALFPGKLNIVGFLRVNFGLLLTQLACAGIGFFASCIAPDARISLGIGAGLPIAMFFLKVIENMGGNLPVVRYLTIYSLFDVAGILAGAGNMVVNNVVLACIAVGFYAAGIGAFSRRELPL